MVLIQRQNNIAVAQLSDSTDQRPGVTTPVEVNMDTNDNIQQITHDPIGAPADIIIIKKGIYLMIAAPQIGRTSGTANRDVHLWFRVNDVDIPDTNVAISLDRTTEKDVIVSQLVRPFDVGDIINIMMSISATGEGLGLEAIEPAGEPIIPSIITTIHSVNLD